MRWVKSLWAGPYVLLLPFMCVFLPFTVFPAAYAIYLSVFSSKGKLFGRVFVGLENYIAAVHDARFWGAVARMIYFSAVQVSVMLVIAVVLALLLDSGISRGAGLYRVVYFLPYAVPGAIAAVLWGYMYDPAFGLVAGIMHTLFGHQVNLLAPGKILYSLMNVVTWEITGYAVLLLLAGLTSVPVELGEAAQIDGASRVTIALRIKVPLIRRMILMVAVVAVVGTLQLLSEPYVFRAITAIRPSFSPNLDIYLTAFGYGDIHFAATLAVILAVVTLAAIGLLLGGARVAGQARGHGGKRRFDAGRGTAGRQGWQAALLRDDQAKGKVAD